jgi:hypothetical protein
LRSAAEPSVSFDVRPNTFRRAPGLPESHPARHPERLPAKMKGVVRKGLFAIPFGCLAAVATHALRFGNDHAFGGPANETLVAAAAAGSVVIALAILHGFLTAGTTTPTGTLAAARARQLIPGTSSVFGLAAALYYGIESLEGHGIELGLPTVLLFLAAALIAGALRAGVARFAGLVARLVREYLALLDRREPVLWPRSHQAQPIHSQVAYATRRLGRAPPNGRRFP